MFHTTLTDEYENASKMGLTESELSHLTAMSFDYAFLAEGQKFTAPGL